MRPLSHMEHQYVTGNVFLCCNFFIDTFQSMVYPYDDSKPLINLNNNDCLQDNTPVCFQVNHSLSLNNKNYVFCNPAYIYYLFYILDYFNLENCILFTGHSDILIDNSFLSIINNNRIIHWFGLNINVHHDKITPLPLGIRIFHQKEVDLFDKYTNQEHNKTRIYNANFNIESNKYERSKCFNKCKNEYVGLLYDTYNDINTIVKYRSIWHENISSAFFELAPRGFSIPLSNKGDNHRIWEALYHKTIPVTTPSPITDYYSKIFPMVIINDWDHFDVNMLTKELYYELWNKYPEVEKYLRRDFFIENIIYKTIKEKTIL